jgi:hypothetical protein
MQSWKIRLGLMVAMLAMLLMVSMPVAVADHDDEWDDGHWLSENWDGDHDDEDDEDDEDEEEWDEDWDEDFEGIELAELDLEVVCFLDADFDGWSDEDWADGHDNDWDGEIDEDDIDCVVTED